MRLRASSWPVVLRDATEMFVFLVIEPSLLPIVTSVGTSLIRQEVSDHRIQQMIGARKGRGYLLAALLGIVTPFHNCSTVSMLHRLLSAKAGSGPTFTFLLVSPLPNPIIVGLMWMTFDWKVTLSYTITAAGVSVLASIVLDSLGSEHHIIAGKSSSVNCRALAKASSGVIYTPIKVSCCSPMTRVVEDPVATCCSTKVIVGINLIKLATRSASQWSKDVLPYLLLGVLIGSFIYGFIPSARITAHVEADNPSTIPLSAAVGTLLYIQTEAAIPLASVLVAKRMGLGALMVLIIGSAGASLTEVILLRSVFEIPMIAAFLAVTLDMAILMGYSTRSLF